MTDRKVSYPFLAQLELGLVLGTIYQVTCQRISLQLTFVVCNFSPNDVGYDLKVRPSDEPTENKHFLRGSATAGEGKLKAGNTEIWSIHFRAGDLYIVEGLADTLNSISVSVSSGEAHMKNE